eukprot:scaffold2868_cov171-Amphora_coffeaeformis.AAC.4
MAQMLFDTSKHSPPDKVFGGRAFCLPLFSDSVNKMNENFDGRPSSNVKPRAYQEHMGSFFRLSLLPPCQSIVEKTLFFDEFSNSR